MIKTGEVNFRDEEGVLWLCESFVDSDGVVSSTRTKLEE